MQQARMIGLVMSVGVLYGHVTLAVVAGPASEVIEQGYRRVAQARLAPDTPTREALLTEALAAFKTGYQTDAASPTSKVHALLGAAQVSLLVQAPRRVFPFLWQATPLQRAEKNLQQVLVFQPDNAAAALLLGIVYWRQATQTTGAAPDLLARSQHYFAQAARLGLPIRLDPAPVPAADPGVWWRLEDTIVALRYVDARGTGRADDLLLVYQRAGNAPIFGTVVTGGQAHALITETSTGVLALQGLLEAQTTIPQPGKPPILVMHLRQGQQLVEARFTWDGTHFVHIPVQQ